MKIRNWNSGSNLVSQKLSVIVERFSRWRCFQVLQQFWGVVTETQLLWLTVSIFSPRLSWRFYSERVKSHISCWWKVCKLNFYFRDSVGAAVRRKNCHQRPECCGCCWWWDSAGKTRAGRRKNYRKEGKKRGVVFGINRRFAPSGAERPRCSAWRESTPRRRGGKSADECLAYFSPGKVITRLCKTQFSLGKNWQLESRDQRQEKDLPPRQSERLFRISTGSSTNKWFQTNLEHLVWFLWPTFPYFGQK